MDPSDDTQERSATADPLGAGLEQFQRAALDAVQAARAVLDAAESVIREPAAIEALVNTVTAMARTATESVAGLAAGMTASGATKEPGEVPDDGPAGYERISVD